MRDFIIFAALIGLVALPVAAQAKGCIKKGCIKEAIVGGVAGHVAGHGKLGAVAGCIIGHHEANRHSKANQKNQPVPSDSRIYATDFIK